MYKEWEQHCFTLPNYDQENWKATPFSMEPELPALINEIQALNNRQAELKLQQDKLEEMAQKRHQQIMGAIGIIGANHQLTSKGLPESTEQNMHEVVPKPIPVLPSITCSPSTKYEIHTVV